MSILDEGLGGYEGVSIIYKRTEDLLRAQSRFLSRIYLYSRLDPRCEGKGLSLRIIGADYLVYYS